MKTLDNIKKELNFTLTENLDIAYKSTFDENLDLFGLMGAMRYNSDDFMTLFIRAYNENQELAIRNLFYLRDVRGGMGERNNFRLGIKWLSENYSNKLINIINEIPEIGRWDDILLLLENPRTKEKTVQFISKQLDEDLNSQNPSLMAKWLPSINTSSFETRKLALFLCTELGMSNKEYRKTLSTLRKQIGVLERKLSKKEYDFDYAKVTSQAMHKYRQAFYRNDEKRYLEYLSNLSKGETKINVGTLYPHQIISKYYKSISNWESKSIEE